MQREYLSGYFAIAPENPEKQQTEKGQK